MVPLSVNEEQLSFGEIEINFVMEICLLRTKSYFRVEDQGTSRDPHRDTPEKEEP